MLASARLREVTVDIGDSGALDATVRPGGKLEKGYAMILESLAGG